jgi:hypothetical protein
MLANACELPVEERAFAAEEARALAAEYGVPYLEVSAKTGDGVEAAFMGCALDAVRVLDAAAARLGPGAATAAGRRRVCALA